MTITEFATMEKETWDVSMSLQDPSGHGGGDHGLVRDFVREISLQDESMLSSTIQASMESHLMGFKAEESRLKGTVERIDHINSNTH